MKHVFRGSRVVALAVVAAVAALALLAGSAGAASHVKVPKKVQKYYAGASYFSKILPNPYAHWTAPKPPWQFCYNDSYQGNDWRQNALAEYQKLFAQYKKAGLAKGKLIVTNSNNDINVQLAQLNNLVRQGCDVILSIPSSPTGLCSGVDNAFKKNVLFVTVESPAFCPKAINVDFNEYWGGEVTAKWLATALHGKGSVVLENGIQGLAPTVARRAAVLNVFKKYPGIKVVGEITGNWTPSVAKSAMLKFLATHPQKIDGVWNGALMGVAAGQAFEQLGRPLPKINGFGGVCAFLAYWKQKHMNSISISQGGGPALYEAFYVAARMLAGQQPVVNTLLYPLPVITDRNFAKWYKPSMNLQSTCTADPASGRAVSNTYFNALFKGKGKLKVVPRP